jgi:DNA invertase Pin-like site-specific DNA recombinase
MDGYIRVSRKMGRDGPGYISPTVQREAIQRWADYKDIEIAAWHTDEDESGGTQDRPGLNLAVQRAVGGETGGIVSWKIDRFSRYTAGGLRDLQDLENAGARLAFVTEDIDTSGPMGKFVYTVMLAMSEYFLANIKASWVTAKTRAVERGAKIGPTPFGYRRIEDGLLEPDPVYGPVVTRAFELAASNGRDAALAHLIKHGNGRTWTHYTVRRLLANRSYLGEGHYGDLVNLDSQVALVNRATFEGAQTEPGARRQPKGTYPMSGLARCATCDNPMVGARGGADARRMYRCSASLSQFKGERCTAPATVSAELLEELTRTALIDALAEGKQPGLTGGEDSGNLADLEAAMHEADRARAEYAADVELQRILGMAAWRVGAEERARLYDEARDAYRHAARRVGQRAVVTNPEVMRNATLDELGGLLRGLLEAVVVTRGRTQLDGRVRFVTK